MKRAMSVFAPILVAGSLLASCLDDSITGTRPISFSLTADLVTVTVGNEVTFSYNATGTQMQGVILDYGDGVVDSVDVTGGNVIEAGGVLMHTFTVPGAFLVRGRVETVAEVRRDSLTIQVN